MCWKKLSTEVKLQIYIEKNSTTLPIVELKAWKYFRKATGLSETKKVEKLGQIGLSIALVKRTTILLTNKY